MKFCVSRILGNELPPRDEKGSRIKSLQFILDNENFGLNRMWVLNRIHDKERLEIFKKMLGKEPIFEIPFVNKEYLRCRNSIKDILRSNKRNRRGSKNERSAPLRDTNDQDGR